MQLFKDKPWRLFFFVLITVLGMVLFSSNKPRGTDQFWHLSDAVSVAQGVYTSNNHFPNSNLQEKDQERARPFVQNRPFVYLAGALVKVVGDAVVAYKIINVLSVLGIFALLILTLNMTNLPKTLWPLLAAAFLAVPGFVFPLFQALPVAFDACLFLAIFYALLQTKHSLHRGLNRQAMAWNLLSAALAVVFAFQRMDHLPFVVLLPFLLLFRQPLLPLAQVDGRRVWLFAAVYLVLLVLGYLGLRPANHLEAFPITLKAILSVGTPADWHNMTFFFAHPSDIAAHNTWDLLRQKTAIFAASLFSLDVMLLPFNLLFSAALLVFVQQALSGPYKRFYLLAACLLLGFYAVVFAFQFQYRYAVFLLFPVALMLLQSAPIRSSWRMPLRVRNTAFAGLLLAGLLIALGSMRKNAADAANFDAFLGQLPPANTLQGNLLVHWYPNPGLSIAYRYRGAKVFYITPSTLHRASWQHIDVIFDHDQALQRAAPELFKAFKQAQQVQGWTLWVRDGGDQPPSSAPAS
jgi:hypothetical protein